MRMRTGRIALLASLVALALQPSCKGKSKEAAAPPATPAAGASGSAAQAPAAGKNAAAPATAKPAAKPAVTADSVRAESLAVLAAWTEAQNKGDSAAYFAMYEPKHFTGVKRTAKGVVKKFDFAGWKKDRTRMFGDKPQVAVDKPEVQTWLDDGAKLKPGVSVIRFVQRWKTERYADHGIKALHVWRDPAKGQQLIIYEDLINAERGWDDSPSAGVADLDDKPPADDAAALALWKKLAPTGKDYEDKLAAIPDDPAFTRPMARALLAGGDFECEKKVEYEECGEEYSEWEPLAPEATFDEPCLRRRLAVWALEDGGLVEQDIEGVAAELEAMLELDRPEDELQPAVMALIEKMSEPLRVRFIAAAVKAEEVELAGNSLDGLSDKSLIEVYRAHSLDAAVKKLDPDKHRDVALEAMTDDDLEVDTRRELYTHFADVEGDDVTKALVEVATEAEDCELAMDAADTLVERGNSSYLPKKPDTTDAGEHGRALCMLMHDGDGARRLAVWKTFLPPKGGPTVTEEYENEFEHEEESEEPDGGAHAAGPDAAPPEPERVTREHTTDVELDDAFGVNDPDCGDRECKVETPNGNYTVTFEVGDDGVLYLSELHTYRWSGCPC